MSSTPPRTSNVVPVRVNHGLDQPVVTARRSRDRGLTQDTTTAELAASRVIGAITSSVTAVRSGSSNSRFTGGEASPRPPDRPDKAAWRSWARRVPVDLPAVSREIAVHLDEWLADEAVVLSYAAMPSELEVILPPRRRTFLLTRTPEEGPLTIHRADGPTERHRFGFRQPMAAVPAWDGDIDVVLVPGLAFSPQGGRLGKGAGYYDRLLGGLPSTSRVGVTAETLVVDGLPIEPHDVAMTHLATQRGVVETLAST